ncbi:MAG: molybdopterin cofactor-binding domain-containing protein [Vicinamibacterales bacterium]
MARENPDFPISSTIEPDRLELVAPPRYRFDVARRDFFRIVGTGLVVACAVRESEAGSASLTAGQESGRGRREELPRSIAAWLHIGEDGRVTAYTGKTEVGQNIRTSLTQAVSEELRVPATSVHLVMADTDTVPFDMGTFGSRTTPDMNLRLRRVASTARRALMLRAASRMGVGGGELEAREGSIRHLPSGRTIGIGDLVKGAQLAELVEDGPLRTAAEWDIQGTPLKKVNGADFVTGRHEYTSDLARPGMLHGAVLRPPAPSAVLASADTAAAGAMAGVQVVRDADFVGVVAPTRRAAARAVGAIRVAWTQPPEPSSASVIEYFRRHREPQPPGRSLVPPHVAGSTADALKAADRVVSGTYTIAYIAHAPMEPRAAVAEWHAGKLTVWTATQRPFGVRDELCAAFRLPADRVRVMVPDAGSAYGGKHTGEAAVEAARLARAAGRPVQVVWSREEEFAHAYCRPGGVIDVKSGARQDGVITAWEYDSYNAGPASIRPIYTFANQRIEMHPTRSPLRVGSYRGLAATANHFVRETHLDEVASALGMDPVELRLRNLSDARQRAVLQAAAGRAGWPARKPGTGQGAGIACGFEKGSYVATVAEVSVHASGVVQLRRLVVAYECGAIVNPDGLRNQVEGAVVQGIGGALFEQVLFENGRVTNGRFEDYRVPRFADIPPIELVLLDRTDLPSAGAGETPIVAVAPAIGNAMFAASGVRLRRLPLVPDGRVARA